MQAVLVQLAALRAEVDDLAAARARDAAHTKALADALDRRTPRPGAAMAHKTARQQRPEAAQADEAGYRPIGPPRWWQLTGRQRDEAIVRLRGWVETVFRPGYGHLARQVGPCWEEHDLCLYQLAWLSEMHTVIFRSPERLLSSEADWHVRLLPGAAALMAAETGRCDHLHQTEHGALASIITRPTGPPRQPGA
jgi:hypothetical protein